MPTTARLLDLPGHVKSFHTSIADTWPRVLHMIQLLHIIVEEGCVMGGHPLWNLPLDIANPIKAQYPWDQTGNIW